MLLRRSLWNFKCQFLKITLLKKPLKVSYTHSHISESRGINLILVPHESWNCVTIMPKTHFAWNVTCSLFWVECLTFHSSTPLTCALYKTLSSICDALKQNESEIMYITLLVFFIVVSGISNVTVSCKPHKSWLISFRDTRRWRFCCKHFPFVWLYLKINICEFRINLLDRTTYRIVSNKRSPSNKRPPNLFSNKTR